MTVNWNEIEAKWQKQWHEAGIFQANPDPSRPKFFLTVAYPYPNSPQHIGHGRTYTLADAHARYKRMLGFNVLFPMGFHYTGTPIVAMAKRLAEGDAALVRTFTDMYKVPVHHLGSFTEPLNIARYFHEEIRRGMQKIGYSIDFRREFTTVDDAYRRFIEWQFHTLHGKGYVSQGSHPVGWCPRCGNPVGQHDTRDDVEPEIEEYTLIKFTADGYILPTGTLRPETVFGVTNLWINPNAEYVKAKVDTENWIVTRECVEKLKFLSRTVHVEQSLPGRDLLSLKTVNPADNRRIPILPAEFVNPKDVTGVVMSVPAHAPYDYMALEDIRKGRTDLSAYNIPPTSLQSLKPLPVISVKGYSAIPAADVTGTMGIKDQHDSHLEDATREVYRREFHEGAMLDHIPKYGGMPVAEAKEAIRADLTENGNAEVMFELQNKPVICRCGAECVVKIFEKQWFLNYGDTQWKELAYKCIENMSILPEHMRTEFKHVVDWLKEKACARKSGLGTKLPWDQDWIIESLSDSTIYMAYYTIAKHLNQAHIPAENLTHAVFDYVFLGIGDVKDIASQSGVSLELLQQMQQEFQYFYPLDVRHSGRDLVSNHLTYFIFNHVALFPPSLWPREIAVNGSVLMEGEKMSKSLGNILPLGDAIDAYGADALRVSLLGTAGLLHDADFSPSLARSTRERLERLLERVERVRGEDATHLDELSLQHLDLWLLSRVQGHIKATSEAMNELETMKACQSALYSLDRDVEWYNNRTTHTAKDPAREETVRTVLREVLRIQTLLLTPFAPHGCEEMWEMLGGAGFAAMASWPQPREDRINIPAEESEGIVGTIIEDVNSIIRATDIKPQKIWIYTSADWKWNIYLNAINYASKSQTDQASFLKEIKSTTAFTMKPKECIKLAQKFLQSAVRTARDLLDRKCTSGRLPEFNILREAQGFLSRHFGVEVEVYDEEDPQRYDPKRRATLAEPRRPAIYIE